MKITENNSVIRDIENSDLEDSDKLLAISEILNIEKTKPEAIRATSVPGLSWMFTWNYSELCHEFWSDVDQIIYDGR
jgi:hypothetical protein